MPAATATIAAPSFALSAVPTAWTLISSVMSNAGRPGGNRTPNLRFWRPPLCQLSYWPELSLDDLGDDAGTHRAPAFPDREPQPLFHRNRRDQRHLHRNVVPRHHHLRPPRQHAAPRHVRRPKIKLRPIPVEVRRVPTPLLLRQHIHLAAELRVRRDRPRLRQHLTTLHFLPLRPPQQPPDVVPGLPLIQELPEHLHPDLHHPPLHPTRHHRPPTRNREHVLHRHQKRTVDQPLRLRNIRIQRLRQLHDRTFLQLPLVPFQRQLRRPNHDRRRVPRKLVLRQQLPHFHLHQLQQLLVVHHVRLVQVDHDVRHPNLPRQQNVLPRLRHRTVRRTHHQNRTIHLRRTRDHVLLVLHVRRVDRDPPRLLLRRIVDLVVRLRLPTVLPRQHQRHRRRQRRLPVIHVPNRPHVHVRLRTLEFALGHDSDSLTLSPSC